jgi:CheY-like chemotaxis protein
MRNMLDRLLPPAVTLDFDFVPGAIARIDRAQFEQVVLNLVVNACESMPTGGTVSLSVRDLGETAELVVADEGVGMDEETRMRIFEPFFTTKRSGTGLGLSTVDGIVAQSGGTIAVATAPGGGTVFTICLPRVAAMPAAAVEPALPADPGSGRLLLVDDEALVRRVAAEMLTRAGYDVVDVESGEAALDVLAAGDVFDVLVTDVAMSGMDGRTLSQRAREIFPHLPVLFVSGYPAEALAREQLVGDDDEVLTKPFTAREVAERVELVRRRAAGLAA